MESPGTNTGLSTGTSLDGASSVNVQQAQGKDSASITAMPQELCGGCCAVHATPGYLGTCVTKYKHLSGPSTT